MGKIDKCWGIKELLHNCCVGSCSRDRFLDNDDRKHFWFVKLRHATIAPACLSTCVESVRVHACVQFDKLVIDMNSFRASNNRSYLIHLVFSFVDFASLFISTTFSFCHSSCDLHQPSSLHEGKLKTIFKKTKPRFVYSPHFDKLFFHEKKSPACKIYLPALYRRLQYSVFRDLSSVCLKRYLRCLGIK